MTDTASGAGDFTYYGQPKQDTSLKTVALDQLWESWPEEGEKDLSKRYGGDLPIILGVAKGSETHPDGGMVSAVRLSIAFNNAGHPLTSSTFRSGKDLKDGGNHFVISDPMEFKAFLERKFGKPKHCKDEATAARCGKG
jgi:hypothetical protein